MVKGIVTEHESLLKLIVRNREEEGIMNELGMNEFREDVGDNVGNLGSNSGGVWWRSNRTRVPAVWMRMRHGVKLELSNGVTMEGATLVVVRPTASAGGMVEEAEDQCNWDGFGFGGVYGEAVEKLINRRSYLLEMNSF
ncbi:putative F-box protein AUF1 [Helianthus annuus]|nr:putative F-box protein AUF1 [Helianthus annuus]